MIYAFIQLAFIDYAFDAKGSARHQDMVGKKTTIVPTHTELINYTLWWRRKTQMVKQIILTIKENYEACE